MGVFVAAVVSASYRIAGYWNEKVEYQNEHQLVDDGIPLSSCYYYSLIPMNNHHFQMVAALDNIVVAVIAALVDAQSHRTHSMYLLEAY